MLTEDIKLDLRRVSDEMTRIHRKINVETRKTNLSSKDQTHEVR